MPLTQYLLQAKTLLGLMFITLRGLNDALPQRVPSLSFEPPLRCEGMPEWLEVGSALQKS